MDKQKLLDQFCLKNFNFAGKFQSNAGFVIPLYPDIRSIYSYPRNAAIIVDGLVDRIKSLNWKFDLIISPATSGIGWGFAVAQKLNKGFGYTRSELKQIQLVKPIEGFYRPGQKIVILDDALSGSKTKKKMIESMDKLNLEVVGVIVFMDALAGEKIDKKFLEKRAWMNDYNYEYLFTWQDMVRYYKKVGFWNLEFSDLMIEVIQNFSNWGDNPKNWQKFKELAINEKNLVLHKSFKEI